MLITMLQRLRVQNLAIVEDIEIDFNGGLNVITGETGAGKSILVDALGLVLGERADKSMIRAGEDKCSVESVFHLSDASSIHGVLDELGLPPCDDGALVLRRVISASGAGRNTVNDSSTTVQALKMIGNFLVDMHGPHDHQSLLSQEFQRELLDAFGHLEKLTSEYRAVYGRALELTNKRQELDCDEKDVATQVDMLSFQVKEIENARLADTDEEDLAREHAIVANAREIVELANGVVGTLNESEGSAFEGLAAAVRQLTAMARVFDEAKAWCDEAESAGARVQELANTISARVQGIECDPERLQFIEDRMALLSALKRKYGGSLAAVLAHLETARARLNDLETRAERIAEIEATIAETDKELRKVGAVLSKERQMKGQSLGKAITAELQGLGFPHAAFDIHVTQVEPGPWGMDEVDFGFAPNVGEPSRPLRVIASSGEISRVMLATKAVLAKHDRVPVLVFDEIDANVGGEMGNAIGARLSAIAGNHQVLCITHLPQVAVHGRTHFAVQKEVRTDRTYTRATTLVGRERVEEIGRMLGGSNFTSVTLKHAEEMLNAIVA
jgi:DNA repair protein RecN (Recombination protein N)